MKNSVEGVAKRLLFSLTVATALGGCAVYDTGYNYPYAGGGAYYTDPVYPAAPVYGYGAAPLYPAPLYVPPPVFRFDYRSGGGHRWHDGGPGWRNGAGPHHWSGGGPRPQAHPGMRGGGRWGSAGTWRGRR